MFNRCVFYRHGGGSSCQPIYYVSVIRRVFRYVGSGGVCVALVGDSRFQPHQDGGGGGIDSAFIQTLIRFFEKDENPLVLVSPSMSEGVDLPYDKCRFQVIYKMPFPYLGDKQVNMRMKRDKKWYAYKTVMTLMQAYGRGMRAEDDSCYTYIIDSDINMLFKSPMYRTLMPDFFKEAIVRLKD